MMEIVYETRPDMALGTTRLIKEKAGDKSLYRIVYVRDGMESASSQEFWTKDAQVGRLPYTDWENVNLLSAQAGVSCMIEDILDSKRLCTYARFLAGGMPFGGRDTAGCGENVLKILENLDESLQHKIVSYLAESSADGGDCKEAYYAALVSSCGPLVNYISFAEFTAALEILGVTFTSKELDMLKRIFLIEMLDLFSYCYDYVYFKADGDIPVKIIYCVFGLMLGYPVEYIAGILHSDEKEIENQIACQKIF
ncbi:hypothetical protein [Parasporobacterium paucivorans]|uniref:Uncharacterized protein n=1 Tax=Parasporobacterium paucivorans DSM 15970 TaxID=1122934 RepID=A0A1M6IFQ6_9FIRM|nr:hypothetical protein [Parasporobacterium paucivorans]SHJ33223.1 hypothetical protein SAMN02745691_01755 [Parasporobacterium paucivorans DSM 15970]